MGRQRDFMHSCQTFQQVTLEMENTRSNCKYKNLVENHIDNLGRESEPNGMSYSLN